MRSSRARLVLTLGILVALAAIGAIALTVTRNAREERQRAALAHAADRGPRVLVSKVEQTMSTQQVTFPGDVRAFEQATVYAKVNGYVRSMLVDKGYRVRRGQVLARIESPETDHQVQAARAALAVSRRNAERAHRLAPHGIVSRQELDQAIAALRTATADLERVRALQEYEVVRAPFDGIVTARYVDPGALLTATSTGQPVVDVAAPERVRIFVYVGQDLAPFVRLGDPGELTIDQSPGVRVAARVQRLADALDPRTRSMLVELWPDGTPAFRLVPGLFVHVQLQVAVPPLPIIPSEALVARGDRTEAALVRDGRLHFVDVEPGIDDGRVVQIRRGLREGDVVALSPPSDLGEGAPIQPVERRREDGQRAARTPPAGR